MITYQTEGIPMPKIQRRKLSTWIKQVASGYGRKVGDIAYIFCNDDKILEVNQQYLNHDYYTDIITFDTVRSNAEERNIPFMSELHRVIIHGILHLCGINDKGPGEREVMESSENRALALLPELGINIE